MSDPEADSKRPADIKRPIRFWPKVSLVILYVISATNFIAMIFVVPKFEQIFTEALPGKPLPSVTLFIFTFRIGLALLALTWPIIGTFLLKKQKPYAIWYINISTIWNFFQIGITTVALFMPMVGLIGNISGYA
jgi:hypothetical protein